MATGSNGEKARPGRWGRLVDGGARAAATGRGRAEQLVERHRHRAPVDVALRLHERDRSSAGTVVGSAVAFRLFLFFVPLLLFVVGLAGFLGGAIDGGDIEQAGLSGGLATQMRAALSQPDTTRWIAVGVGLVGMASTGRALSKTMVSASCLAWQLPVVAKASVKLTGAIVGLVAGVGLVSIIVNRVRSELGLAITGMSFGVALLAYAVAWVLVMAVLPRPTRDPAVVVPGAIVLAATLVGMQAVSQLYLPGRFSHASEVYGAIGTAVVVLGWFFILGRAIVLSMALNAVVLERFGSISDALFALPVLRALPRRSPRLARFFGRSQAPGASPGDGSETADTRPGD